MTTKEITTGTFDSLSINGVDVSQYMGPVVIENYGEVIEQHENYEVKKITGNLIGVQVLMDSIVVQALKTRPAKVDLGWGDIGFSGEIQSVQPIEDHGAVISAQLIFLTGEDGKLKGRGFKL